MVDVVLLEIVYRNHQKAWENVASALEGKDKENAELSILKQILDNELNEDNVRTLYGYVMEIARSRDCGWRLPLEEQLTADTVQQFRGDLAAAIEKLLSNPL